MKKKDRVRNQPPLAPPYPRRGTLGPPGGAYVPAFFVGIHAPRRSAPANGRIHPDEELRDVCATQFSSIFAGRRPMGTDLTNRRSAPSRKGVAESCFLTEQSQNVYENKGSGQKSTTPDPSLSKEGSLSHGSPPRTRRGGGGATLRTSRPWRLGVKPSL